MEETDIKQSLSPKSSNDTAPALPAVPNPHSGKSIRLQRANSSFPSTTTATALSSTTNGSSGSISAQQVRQKLKEHLLSRRVMSVNAGWGVASNSGNATAALGCAGGQTPPQTHVTLRRFSRSFDSDPTVSPPSPPPGGEGMNKNSTGQRHPPSPPSLPRKRAAYHRSAAISLELPMRQASGVLVGSVPTSSTFDEIAIEKLNSIWREAKPHAHFQQSTGLCKY